MAFQSISDRFRRSTTRTIWTLMLFFFLLAMMADIVSLEKKLQEALFNASAVAKVTLPTPVWNLDDKVISDVMDVLFLDSRIQTLELRSEGVVVAERHRGDATEHPEWDYLTLKQSFPIHYQERTLATIHFSMTRHELLVKLAVDAIGLILIGAILAWVITRRSLQVTERFVFAPITSLERSASTLATGDLDTQIDIQSDDEIGSLGRSFSRMRDSIRTLVEQLRGANKALEEHNQVLEQRVEERTQELNTTLQQVEQANAEIMESIQYSERIQKSLLPHLESVHTYLPRSFILFNPRDIVGGDFFFTHKFADGYFIAVFDCTGHGVPGALMTMISISSLRTILFDEAQYHDPARVLQRLNAAIKTILRQDTDRALSDDGLDAAVCFLQPQLNRITFSGARMPLFYTNPEGEVSMLKGDNHSLGYRRSDIQYRFSNQILDADAVQSVYIASDGFVDQLGGTRSFPFGNKRFRQVLATIQELPFDDQEARLLEALQAYRGEHPIQDDITVIGFSTTQTP